MNVQAEIHNWGIIIPARIGSTRLPRKPLQKLAGTPLILRVCENLKILENFGAKLLVATDDPEVKETCENSGIQSVITSTKHISGTDRCFEASNYLLNQKYFLNVQGDEPFIDPLDLIKLTQAHEKTSLDTISTLVYKSNDLKQYENKNTVKTIIDQKGQAKYFSRSPVPFLEIRSPSHLLFFSILEFMLFIENH